MVQALGCYLRGRHTAVTGDMGAVVFKQKSKVLTHDTGVRVGEVMGWEADPHRNVIPCYDSDNDLAYCAWETSSRDRQRSS